MQNAIQPSRPVIRTETIYATNTIPINFGNKKLFTTITSSVGVTTVTEYEAANNNNHQRTAAPQALPNPAFNPAAGLPQLQPSFRVTSSAVVESTTLPSTVYKEIRITFRNTPTLTTLTSTTMVATQA